MRTALRPFDFICSARRAGLTIGAAAILVIAQVTGDVGKAASANEAKASQATRERTAQSMLPRLRKGNLIYEGGFLLPGQVSDTNAWGMGRKLESGKGRFVWRGNDDSRHGLSQREPKPAVLRHSGHRKVLLWRGDQRSESQREADAGRHNLVLRSGQLEQGHSRISVRA